MMRTAIGRLLRPTRSTWAGALVLALALLTAGPAWAQNQQIDLSSFYRADLRALAMGNAFGPIARGENALLYNPAGLAQRTFDVKAEASLVLEGEAGPFFSDTQKQLSANPTPAELQQYLSNYLGESNSYRAQTFINAVATLGFVGVGAGQMKQLRYRFSFTDNAPAGYDAGDSIDLTKDSLDLNVASGAFKLLDGQMLLGATLKSFTFKRETASQTFGSATTIDLATTGPSYKASGYDLGMIWRLESFSFFRPQWSLVAHNVGGITLQNSTTPTAYDVPATYNVGIALNPPMPLPFLHLLLAFEYEDVTNAVKIRDLGTDHSRTVTQRLHYGVELGIWETSTGNNVLNVRYGRNRGGLTYGAEINLWSALRIAYVNYEDDFGYDGKADVHKFQALQATLGIGF